MIAEKILDDYIKSKNWSPLQAGMFREGIAYASLSPQGQMNEALEKIIKLSNEWDSLNEIADIARTALDSLPGDGGDGSPYCQYCGNAKKSFGDGSIRPLCTCPK